MIPGARRAGIAPGALAVASVLALLGVPRALAGDGATRPNPWRSVPVGTVLEVEVVRESGEFRDDMDRGKNLAREKSREVWTVVARDAATVTVEKVVTGEKTGESRTREPVALDPVDALPDEPSGTAAAVAEDGSPKWGGREDVKTDFGTFACIVVVRRRSPLESSFESREWWTASLPVPLKATTRSSGGNGVTREENVTRTVVAWKPGKAGPAAPGGMAARPANPWAAFPQGTRFTFEVEKVTGPFGGGDAKPETTRERETWTLESVGAARVKLTVREAAGGAREVEVDAVPAEPVAGETGRAEDHTRVTVGRERLTTPLGEHDCVHVTREHSMIDASGRSEEWRSPDFPLPLKTFEALSAKRETRTTRTLVSVSKPGE